MEIEGFKNNIDRHVIMHKGYSSKGRHYLSHEFLFIEVLLRLELSNFKVAKKFVSYVLQYYPDYDWQFIDDDLQSMAIVETALHEYRFIQKYNFGLNIAEEKINHTLNFGEIATNFCIENLGYSLIGCGGTNTIITAQDNYEKNFLEYILKGYNIFKLKKLYYVDDKFSFVGYFKELDSLPSHCDYCNKEYIEDEKHVFQKVY